MKRDLTKREGEIAALVSEGLSNKEIGKRLGLTEGSVKQHLYSIFKKLGVKRRMMIRSHQRPAAQIHQEK
jgi:DNA-binding CsgD family transcriptional regulator